MTPFHRYRASALCLLLSCTLIVSFTQSASADQVEFHNGDRLSGKIVSMDSGKITLKSDVAGEIDISLDKIRTFSTVEPIAVHLSDGTVINESFEAAGDGEVRSASSSRRIAFGSLDSINPPEPAWHGSIMAGATFERGNSYKNEANIRFVAERKYEISKLSAFAEYDGERNKDKATNVSSTSDRDITAGLRFDRDITERWSWFALSEYEKDGTKDLDLRLKTAAGPTYHWWKDEKFGLSTDLGLSYVTLRYSDSANDEDFAGLLLGWDLYWQIVDHARFFHKGTWEPALEEFFDIQFIETSTGIRTDLTASFFLETRVDWDWNSEPSSGNRREDVDYIFALGYKF